MSDTQQGADWWLASDGKWYPPQQEQQQAAYAPPAQGAMSPQPAYDHPQPAYDHPQPAYGYQQGGRRVGKTRSPWGTWGLALITFGVYHAVWWYKVNEEVKGYDPSIDVKPGMATLALFVPVASIVTIVKTGERVGRVERAAGSHAPASGGLGFLFALLFGGHIIYYQTHLNQVWAQHGSPPEGSPV